MSPNTMPVTPCSAPDAPQLPQHAVDAVGLLVHVLEEEQRRLVAAAASPRRAGGRREQRQAAAAQHALGAARRERQQLVGLARVGRALAGQPVPQGRGIVGAVALRELAGDHRPVQAREPDPLHLEMQQRDVAVAQQQLRVVAQQLAVEVRQQVQDPRPAARAGDGGDLGIFEELVELIDAVVDRARREAAALQDPVAQAHREAQPLELGGSAPQPLLVDRARRRRDADQVAGAQRPWLAGHVRPGSPSAARSPPRAPGACRPPPRAAPASGRDRGSPRGSAP